MSDNGQSTVNSLVSGINSSINAAVQRLQDQQAQQAAQAAAAANVQDYQKTVKKSSSNNQFYATDIGILAKETTRLTVASNLAANDTVDFYKFKVTTKGDATMSMLGDNSSSDSSVRVQLMSKTGMVLADNDKTSGDAYDNFTKLQQGNLNLDRGDYTLRVTRMKGTDTKAAQNYAVQLRMGGYTQDYDTIAKQPAAGDSPWQLTTAQQGTIDALNAGVSSAASISYGQTGTQKLLGSFSLFV